MAQAIFKGVRQYFAQHPVAIAQSAVPSPAQCCSADKARTEPTTKSNGLKKSTDKSSLQKAAPVKSASTKAKPVERKHVVVRGDTLTDIALRYGVSSRAIKAANNMKTDNVKLGQTLKIPAQL